MPEKTPGPSPDSSIHALIELLADDHPEVVEAARAKLVEMGTRVVQPLEQAMASHRDSKVRVEAQGVLERIRLDTVGRDWKMATAVPDEQIDLEQGVFLVARVRYQDLDFTQYHKQLDDLAEKVRPKLKSADKPRERLEVLNHFLFDDERFRGNCDDYFDPQNSYLNRVLERKLGIPISLSVLYLLMCKRLRIPLKGVGIPGHFMVKYQDERTELYVDTFNGGRFLSRPQCVQFLVEAGYPYQSEFLDGVGPREILARMLRNVILIYVDRHETTLEKTLTRFMDLLYADQPEGQG